MASDNHTVREIAYNREKSGIFKEQQTNEIEVSCIIQEIFEVSFMYDPHSVQICCSSLRNLFFKFEKSLTTYLKLRSGNRTNN